jgi:Tfp pilus assembly protein PilN
MYAYVYTALEEQANSCNDYHLKSEEESWPAKVWFTNITSRIEQQQGPCNVSGVVTMLFSWDI